MDHGIYTNLIVDKKYLVNGLLGKGGTGEVYLASHIVIKKQVAIKFLRSENNISSSLRQRLHQEALTAASIRHKNVIDIVDVGLTYRGDPYLVMEYLPGENLSVLLQRCGPLDLPTTCGVLEPVLQALAAAHQKKIIHRDLKPDNIFLIPSANSGESVKLIDFGISKAIDASKAKHLTQTGTTVGTPAYMSVEQVGGHKRIDHRTDLYSVGVIMYEMLTRRLPFEADDFGELLIKILQQPPTPVSHFNPHLSQAAQATLNKALEKDPARRFQTAEEMLSALQKLEDFRDRGQGLSNLLAYVVPPKPVHVDADVAKRQQVYDVTTPATDQPKDHSRRDGRRVRPAVLFFWLIPISVFTIGVFFAIQHYFAEPVSLRTNQRAELQDQPQPVPTSNTAPNGPTIEIEISGAPEGAKIFYDNTMMRRNPFSVRRWTTEVVLKIIAPGFRPFETTVMPTANQQIAVEMVPVKIATDRELDTPSQFSKRNRAQSRATAIDRSDTDKNGSLLLTSGSTSESAKSEDNTRTSPARLKTGRKGTLYTEDFN